VRDDRVYLHHIRDAIGLIESYTSGSREAFLSNPMMRDAVLHNLQIIGEAVKNLSEEFRLQHSEVPRRRIAGLRHVLVHQYFGVSPPMVWEVVEALLPKLKRQVEGLLAGGAP
jgi:uncharacterized protein with HEPN domain